MNQSTKPSYAVNLPQTDFPMRAGLPTQEPKWIQRWQDEGIYQKLQQRPAPNGRFILHCGPPYANGHLHAGHALSYVTKDFIVRSKSLAGYQTPFVPGWDCHGLPIEWKVEEGLRAEGKTKYDLSITELRNRCRAYARKWVDAQREDWRRFGVVADLDNPYLTMDKANEAGIVRALGKLAGKGMLYRGVKSVNWSTVEETALAEAEIEYHDHTSTAVYVALPLVEGEKESIAKESIVIWTTTPWTLPANRAVAFGAEIDYVGLTQNGHTYWVAAALADAFAEACGLADATKGAVRPGASFAGLMARQPLYDTPVPLLEGFHVTTESGTGFVHIAPAHGAEDFQIGRENGLELTCPVSGNGTYEAWVQPVGDLVLAGADIWQTQPKIVEHLRGTGRLLKAYKYQHSYPHSWRSKAPLIFRTTPQWFMALDETGVRQQALTAIDRDAKWLPETGRNRIYGMIENRPDWCLSRQRAWGVPITIFTDKITGEPLLDEAAFDCVAKHIDAHGIDAWNTMTPAELLAGYAYAGDVANLEKETDILDVWFDSGTSWLHVLGERPEYAGCGGVADVYFEGSDQHRGWFHTSLLTSVALTGHAPYRQVITHGYVVDGTGRKMSKSIGNGIEPKEITDKFGMDIMRLWIAASDFQEDVRLSDQIITSAVDSYRRLRNTCRYLLGNLHGFDAAEHTVAYADLPELERWVLSRLYTELQEARTAYDNYEFHKVYQQLHNFCATELSNLYFDIRKDTLYCEAADSPLRRSVQTVLHALLQGLMTHLAPLIPFTTDEVWRAAFGDTADSIHLGFFYMGEASWQDAHLEARWAHIWEVRHAINKHIEPLRAAGEIKTNAATCLQVTVPTELYDRTLDTPWAELLMAARVTVEPGSVLGVEISLTAHEKCPRCWRHMADIGQHKAFPELCVRCAEAEAQHKAGAAA